MKAKADWSTVDERGYWDFNLNDMFRRNGYKVCKSTNIKVQHLDVVIYERDPHTNRPIKEYNGQVAKYPNYFKSIQQGKINFKTVKYD